MGNKLVIDIETNDLAANMIDFSSLPYKLKDDASLWCVVVRDVASGKFVHKSLDGITRSWMKKVFRNCDEIIGHNGIKFDFLMLKLFGVLDYEVGYLGKPDKVFGKEVKITDTLIRSRLLNPDRYGGHSLQAWGERLGDYKDDFRQQSIEAGIIAANSPRGAEFRQYSEIMLNYCIQDTKVTVEVYKELAKEYNAYSGWEQAEKLENKLADLAIRRESYGFWFNKEAAIEALEWLTKEMQKLADNVNPHLPPKPMGKTALKAYNPPARQFNENGAMSANLKKFAAKHGAELDEKNRLLIYKGKKFKLPLTEYIETHVPATIDDLDHVKMHLIDLGWVPLEWKIRDLTKDSKKQNLSYEKRIAAMDRWLDQTFDEGKYKKLRLRELGMGTNKAVLRRKLSEALKENKPVRVPTSPAVRTGVEKELCANLVALGDKASFAKDFTLYLTYKHRKSSIAGGDIEDMDFDEEYPNTGFLSMYREIDGRVPTPAIEIGASTNRYRHIGVCNIARGSSIFGKEMRSLFGCGEGMLQLGFDFSSLEARIQGHYIMPYNGEDLAKQLLAEKPNDIHSLNAQKLGIPRDQAKSISYALMYGAAYQKLKKMLNISDDEAKELFDAYWDAVKPLSDLKDATARKWKSQGKKFVVGIDGRKIVTRSQHSLLNALFQSGGVICAKYTTVLAFQELEEAGYRCDPFTYDELDCCSMIEYHDEAQLAVNPKILKFKTFDTEEEFKEFKENWTGAQLSSETDGKNGKIVVTLPNPVSTAITNAIKTTEELLNLNVALGIEWVVNKDWYKCH